MTFYKSSFSAQQTTLSAFRLWVHKSGIPTMGKKDLFMCLENSSGRHRSLEQQVQAWLTVVSSPAKGEPGMCQKSLIQQWPGPNSLSRFFPPRARNACPLFSNTRKRTSLSRSQSNQPMKAGGLGFLFLFFFKGLNEVIASCWQLRSKKKYLLVFFISWGQSFCSLLTREQEIECWVYHPENPLKMREISIFM